MKKLLLIVGAVLVVLWLMRSQSSSPARSSSPAVIEPDPIGSTDPTSPKFWRVAPTKNRGAADISTDLISRWGSYFLGTDLGALGSNLMWDVWDPYLGALGGYDAATGIFHDPFAAKGTQAYGGGGFDRPETGSIRKFAPMYNKID